MITTSDLDNIYVLEWSYSQRCFHIDTLKRSLKINTTSFYENFDNVWLIVGIFNTQEEAYHLLHMLERVERDRRKMKK